MGYLGTDYWYYFRITSIPGLPRALTTGTSLGLRLYLPGLPRALTTGTYYFRITSILGLPRALTTGTSLGLLLYLGYQEHCRYLTPSSSSALVGDSSLSSKPSKVKISLANPSTGNMYWKVWWSLSLDPPILGSNLGPGLLHRGS